MKNRILPVILSASMLLLLGFTYGKYSGQQADPLSTFEQFAVEQLLDSLKASQRPYLPFLNRSTLRCGIYRLEAGAKDGQSPHELDEVYYVLSGRGQFKVGEEIASIKPGDVLFVAAHATHQFYDIEEDLELLVFFSTENPE